MTCVGVVDADLGLANGDPRAAERTFQLLSQVTGRAGRAGGKSVGLLQTYAPEHPVIDAIASGDREAFYDREIALRQSSGLPPFARLVALIISGTDKRDVEAHAKALKFAAPKAEGVMILGPAEAPMALVRGRFRYRLLVHTQKTFDVQAYLRAWLKQGPKERGSLRVQIDVDPQSFL
jgi:primosomal protein N' (replication factor Y)